MRKILICAGSIAECEKYSAMLRGKYEVKSAVYSRDTFSDPNFQCPDAAVVSETAGEAITILKNKGDFPVVALIDAEKKTDEFFFSLGCDDFICFPVNDTELNARIGLLLRREKENGNIFLRGGLAVDYDSCRVTVNGEPVHLTLLEYKLLSLLSRNYGKVLSYKQIVDEMWQDQIGNEIKSLRVFASTLRKKLSFASGGNGFIQTHMGIGYCMVSDEE